MLNQTKSHPPDWRMLSRRTRRMKWRTARRKKSNIFQLISMMWWGMYIFFTAQLLPSFTLRHLIRRLFFPPSLSCFFFHLGFSHVTFSTLSGKCRRLLLLPLQQSRPITKVKSLTWAHSFMITQLRTTYTHIRSIDFTSRLTTENSICNIDEISRRKHGWSNFIG